ncbi:MULTISPECIES: carbohydrate ABC transporter permease [Microbacterium]|uniref:Sugar ABC transporter permease n=1 Tax=Microbacterium wangchenii TaxID=2541726 RepID=A0ABX5STT7_9MICO|nr:MULTISPECIES: sugar ABC transporter permease [Microbacterium]MCK6067905.1 sugar ABC transporter permease [Microbacterium sp. EYE_512]QBR89207.1 sugar ABC transporter permease [Microbacterium wangchenii]TXK10877.1 sugar ABC transporter permease [Microbacterium wangchenii]
MASVLPVVGARESELVSPRRGDTGRSPRPIRRFAWYTPWLFLAPFLVFFGLFVAFPSVFGVWISLHNYDYNFPVQPWVGLQNYIDLFTPGTRDFDGWWQSLGNTGLFVLISVVPLVVLPLLVALALNRRFRGRTVYRAIFFAPYVLSVSVIGLLWRYLLDAQFGPVNAILKALGLPAVSWLQTQPGAWVSILVATVWWTLGFNTIVFLAGLQNIPADQYEAAALDGANSRQVFRFITLPGLRTVTALIIVLTVLASANLFGQPYIMTLGGPSNSTRTAIMYIAESGLTQSRMGVASAMGYLLGIILVVVSMINFWLTSGRGRKDS